MKWLKNILAALARCPCGQVEGGHLGFREHWCTHGCPDHGPCTSGVCVWTQGTIG